MVETFDMSQHEPAAPITKDYILDNIEDLLVFRFYLGDFVIGRKVKSPLRGGGHLSISLGSKDAALSLRYKDWVTGEVGDCFKLVSRIHNITYGEAIKKVACDFGLVKGCSIVTKKQLQEAREFKEQAQQEYIIDVVPRKMSKPELAYWTKYAITEKELGNNAIFAIDKLFINKKQSHLKGGLHFAYGFPNNKVKIYSPEETECRFFGNVSAFTLEGVTKWNPEHPVKAVIPLIITKSRKDRIILKKLYPFVINCQNEAETAISKEWDEQFSTQYPAKYVWFDSDEPGKTACKKLNSRGYKWINVSNDLYEQEGLKDPADVIKHFGWEEGSKILIEELKKKGII